METLYLIGLGLLAVGFLSLFINSSTRPYALKFFWVFFAAAIGLVGAILGGRRKDPWSDGADSTVVDLQREVEINKAKADADKARARLKSQAALDEHDAERRVIGEISDRRERYKALAALGRR